MVISDWLMPGMDGIGLCRRIREAEANGASGYTYFLFMTSLDGKQHFLEGMQAGADDYLTKPVDLDELAARLLAAERVTSLHRALRGEERGARAAQPEEPRGGPHRPADIARQPPPAPGDLELLRGRVGRYGHRYAAALCDVDHFKKYNDCHGHLAGDQVLLRVAQAIARGVRSGDAVYRYGGEEFLVILPEQSEASAHAAMDRIRVSVERMGILHEGKDPPGPITLSVGIAAMTQGDTGTWEAWLKRADDALYQAKEAGRNRVVCYGAAGKAE